MRVKDVKKDSSTADCFPPPALGFIGAFVEGSSSPRMGLFFDVQGGTNTAGAGPELFETVSGISHIHVGQMLEMGGFRNYDDCCSQSRGLRNSSYSRASSLPACGDQL